MGGEGVELVMCLREARECCTLYMLSVTSK